MQDAKNKIDKDIERNVKYNATILNKRQQYYKILTCHKKTMEEGKGWQDLEIQEILAI